MRKNLLKNILLIIIFLIMSFSMSASKKISTHEEILKNYDFDKEVKGFAEQLKKEKVNEKSINLFVKAVYAPRPEKKEILLEAIKADRKNYAAYYFLGYFYENSILNSDKDKAIEAYEKGLEINHKQGYVIYTRLGDLYLDRNDFINARKLFEKGVIYFPKTSRPYFDLAVLSIRMGKIEDAFLYIEKSIEKADKEWPDDKFKRDYEKIPSIVILIRTYFHINQYNKGFEIFYDAYSDMADILSESYLDEVVNMMKSENEKIKETHNELYKKNIEKFKDLEIIK